MFTVTARGSAQGRRAASAALIVLLASLAGPAAADEPIEVRVIGARPSADGAALELTVAALVEGKAPPNTPSAKRVSAVAGTVVAPATAVRSIAGEPRAVTLLIDTGALPPPDGIVHRSVAAFLEDRPPTEAVQIVSVDHEPHGLDGQWTASTEDLGVSLKAVRIPNRPGSLLFEAVGRSLEGLAAGAGLPAQRAMILVSDGLDLGSTPPWTFDFVRGLAEDSGIPIIPIFVPPVGRGQSESARRSLAVLAKGSGGRVIDLAGADGAWPNVTAPALERALIQAGAILDGVFVVSLETGSLPAGRVTGTLSMLGLKTPFNVTLASPVIAPDVKPSAAAPEHEGSSPASRPGPLVLFGLVLLVSAGVAFLVARRTAGPSWEEIAAGDGSARRAPPPQDAPADVENDEDVLTTPVPTRHPSTFDPPSSAAFDPPPAPPLDPVIDADLRRYGAWSSAELSHRGPREENQDFLGSIQQPDRPERVLFVLADGMGGHAGGYQASRTAVDATLQTFLATGATAEPEELLRSLVIEANEAVHLLAESSAEFHGCGTTLVLLLAEGRQIHRAHVGDSRLYRLRGGELEQLTADHSLLRLLVEAGAITAEEAAVDPRGHVLSQAVGSSRSLNIEVAGPMTVADGDRFLLCSDGLSGALSAERMAEIMSSATDAESARLLIMDALNAGTEDNTTVLLVSA